MTDTAALRRSQRDAAARRRSALTDQVTRIARDIAPHLLPATVVRVDAAAGLDNDAVCWVTFDTAATPVDVPYPDGYTPTVGHQVELIAQGGEYRILHRLRGISKPPTADELEF